jgi:DNA-binding transcriptional ArsR family regulator
MDDLPNIPGLASLLADPARAAMVAGELAFAANVSPQSASTHLSKLVEGGLLVCHAQGRHRYYRIASEEAAFVIESVASFANSSHRRTPRRPELARRMSDEFVRARTCYNHLAGALAVEVLSCMLGAGWLVAENRHLLLTEPGRSGLLAMGLDIHALAPRKYLARPCVDLTERRPHISGPVGAMLLDFYLREGWLLRAGKSRCVEVTAAGEIGFQGLFDRLGRQQKPSES